MRTSILAALILASVAAVARPIAAEPATRAHAADADAATARGGEPLGMSADKLDLDVEAKKALLVGHVKLTRGELTVRCPRVDVRYDDAPRVTWAKGSGGVVAEIKGVRAEAPEVEIDFAARSLTMRGGVRVTRGEGWLSAERASIDMATRRISMSEVKGSLPLPAPAP